MISNAIFCIFDITEQDKPNVFIELGYALGVEKHVVLTSKVAPPSNLGGYDLIRYGSLKELQEQLINHLPTILDQTLPNKLEKSTEEISQQVRETLNQKIVETTKKPEGGENMKFQGALIKEQGITFAIVIVKSHILNNSSEANKIMQAFQPVFPGTPVVLMAQDSRGVPTYYGRKDIVNFMANVPLEAVPWKEYTMG